MSNRFMMVQVECFHTVLFPKALYRITIRCRQVCRPSHTSKAPGVVLFYCSLKFQYPHGSWFLVMHVLFLSGAGWFDQSEIHHPSDLGRLTDPVDSRLTGSCCFGSELGRLSSQLSVSPLASSPLSAGGPGVGLSMGSTLTTWVFIFCLPQVVTNGYQEVPL